MACLWRSSYDRKINLSSTFRVIWVILCPGKESVCSGYAHATGVGVASLLAVAVMSRFEAPKVIGKSCNCPEIVMEPTLLCLPLVRGEKDLER